MSRRTFHLASILLLVLAGGSHGQQPATRPASSSGIDVSLHDDTPASESSRRLADSALRSATSTSRDTGMTSTESRSNDRSESGSGRGSYRRNRNRQSETQPAISGSSWESYRVLVTRNIFLRDRSRARTGGRGADSIAYRGNRSLVLTGVGERDTQAVAFFEDPSSGRTLRVSVGDLLGLGRVTQVTLDGVEYQVGDVTRKIAIGQNLAGTSVALADMSAPPEQATTQESSESPASAPASPAVAPLSDPVLERLRQRRVAEMNR